MRPIFNLLAGVLLFASTVESACAAAQPDVDREKRMAAEIVETILDGEPIQLNDGKREFLGIFTEADAPKGNVLILHGRGFHPDWSSVIQPLRVGLAERGWNTLTIQLPVLNKAAKYFDYVDVFPYAGPRIEAALAFLRAHGGGHTVIVAHSCGSHMAQHWVLRQGEKATRQFDAFIGIGMGATDYRQPMAEPFALDRMTMPLLDVYGEEDYPAVLRMAGLRSKLIDAAGNPLSGRAVIAGAGHYYVEHGDVLTEAIADWLDTLPAHWR
jgi:pimeloyl-ACP methyl ester carboxylesterase